MNSLHQIHQYRKKYTFMKRKIKGLILENAALCDEVAKIQESILIVKEERKFLLRKLLEIENEFESQHQQSNLKDSLVVTSNGSNVKLKKSEN